MTPPYAALIVIASTVILINYRILFPALAGRIVHRNRKGEQGKVVAVIDGDTIKVSIDGKVQTVRYIGINAPERGQLGADEATQLNRRLVMDKWVRMEADQRDEDQYGRKLRYVWVGRKLVNRALYQRGVVDIMAIKPNTKRIEEIES